MPMFTVCFSLFATETDDNTVTVALLATFLAIFLTLFVLLLIIIAIITVVSLLSKGMFNTCTHNYRVGVYKQGKAGGRECWGAVYT